MFSIRTVHTCLLLVMVASSGAEIAASGDANSTEVDLSKAGIGYELVQERLDYLQYRFLELFVLVKELGETVLKNQRALEENQQRANQLAESNQKKIIDRVDELERQNYHLEVAVSSNVSLISNYAKQILDLQSICANHDIILQELDHLKPNYTRSEQSRLPSIYRKSLMGVKSAIRSCNDTNSKTSGLFELLLPGSETTLTVYCEMESFGGGWLVFQQRVNGSVDFYRSWAEYRDGFGVVGGDFWLGLNTLHR